MRRVPSDAARSRRVAETAGAFTFRFHFPMNVLILAAGYATRLYPLTLTKAKPLLEVAGKPMIEWVLDNLAPIPDIETVYVVTNDKFADDFQDLGGRLREIAAESRTSKS